MFPRMEVRLAGLQSPGSSFLPFLKIGVTLAFLLSSSSSPILQDLSKMMESGSARMHYTQSTALQSLLFKKWYIWKFLEFPLGNRLFRN